jgi:PAS domain S-box-containing protein
VLVAIVTLVAAANNWLVVNVVLKKISQISTDVDTLGQSNTKNARLSIGKTYDEVDTLRTNINSMLDKLSTEKHRGDSVIDLINAIVISLSVDKKVLSINPIGCKTLGYTQEEAVGKDWTKTFIPQASRTKVSQVFDSLISGDQGKYSYFDNEVLTKDGRTILVSWHNTLIKNSEGKVVSTLSLGEDITLEKKAEVKKEAYAKNLERMNRAMINRELKMIELKKELGKTKTDQA